jgi:hypothetical protein
MFFNVAFYSMVFISSLSLAGELNNGIIKYKFASTKTRWELWNIRVFVGLLHIVVIWSISIFLELFLHFSGNNEEKIVIMEIIRRLGCYIIIFGFITLVGYLISLLTKKGSITLIIMFLMFAMVQYMIGLISNIIIQYDKIYSVYKYWPNYVMYRIFAEESCPIYAYIELVTLCVVLYILSYCLYKRARVQKS